MSSCGFHHFPRDFFVGPLGYAGFNICEFSIFFLFAICGFIPLWLAEIPASLLIGLEPVWWPTVVCWGACGSHGQCCGPVFTGVWGLILERPSGPTPIAGRGHDCFSLQFRGRSPCTSGAPTRCACGPVGGACPRPSTSYSSSQTRWCLMSGPPASRLSARDTFPNFSLSEMVV